MMVKTSFRNIEISVFEKQFLIELTSKFVAFNALDFISFNISVMVEQTWFFRAFGLSKTERSAAFIFLTQLTAFGYGLVSDMYRPVSIIPFGSMASSSTNKLEGF